MEPSVCALWYWTLRWPDGRGLEDRLTSAGGSATHRRPDGLCRWHSVSRSSRGPGHRPFTAVTRVRISYGTPIISIT
jgi:hypothetical protein